MGLDEPLDKRPKLGIECMGLEYCLPGYFYGLGGRLEAIDGMRAGELERAYYFRLGGRHAYADLGVRVLSAQSAGCSDKICPGASFRESTDRGLVYPSWKWNTVDFCP